MKLKMICTHEAAGVHDAEARRLRIFHRMGLDDMSDLTTAIILSLAFDFQAEAEIFADQWFGVSISSPLLKEDIWIECDHPADGLAALWEHLAEHLPEKVSVKAGDPAAARRVTERISAALLAQYDNAEASYQTHRKAAHNGPNDCPRCEDCTVGLALSITAHLTLDRSWGSEVLDVAVEKAFE